MNYSPSQSAAKAVTSLKFGEVVEWRADKQVKEIGQIYKPVYYLGLVIGTFLDFYEIVDLSEPPQPSPVTVGLYDIRPTGEHYTHEETVEAAAQAMRTHQPVTPDFLEHVRTVLFAMNGIE